MGVLVNPLIQVIAGAVGGNVVGTMKDFSLGPVGNSIAGDLSDSASMNVWLHKQVMQKLAENVAKVFLKAA